MNHAAETAFGESELETASGQMQALRKETTTQNLQTGTRSLMSRLPNGKLQLPAWLQGVVAVAWTNRNSILIQALAVMMALCSELHLARMLYFQANRLMRYLRTAASGALRIILVRSPWQVFLHNLQSLVSMLHTQCLADNAAIRQVSATWHSKSRCRGQS